MKIPFAIIVCFLANGKIKISQESVKFVKIVSPFKASLLPTDLNDLVPHLILLHKFNKAPRWVSASQSPSNFRLEIH